MSSSPAIAGRSRRAASVVPVLTLSTPGTPNFSFAGASMQPEVCRGKKSPGHGTPRDIQDDHGTAAHLMDTNTVPKAPSFQDGAEIQNPEKCVDCDSHERDTWYCNVCEHSLCQQCWDKQLCHRNPGNKVHEKTDRRIAKKVNAVLWPPEDAQIRKQLYRDDEANSWFGMPPQLVNWTETNQDVGVEQPEGSPLSVFQDYGRFAALMDITNPARERTSLYNNWTNVDRDCRTPSLVSFVGQTGAGKSTLVKLLVDFHSQGTGSYDTPVVGSRTNNHIPTSDNVHLYLDPLTAYSSGPLLYADCEGLDGGEQEPQSSKLRKQRRLCNTNLPREPPTAVKVVSTRELRWAKESRNTRGLTVAHLYPRILYTFSDVIVFVLRNPRCVFSLALTIRSP